MRQKGIVYKWNDEKGFGFIKSNDQKSEYFFHINSFRNSGQRPVVGAAIDFEFGKDKQGRAQAVNVRPIGSKKENPTFNTFIISSLFLALVAILAVAGFLPKAVMWLYIGASAIAFLLYFKDKSASEKGRRRTPEATLHNIALIGGWPGALFAQQLLRHKSRKESFRRMFWITVFTNIAALIYLLSPYGGWLTYKINQIFI